MSDLWVLNPGPDSQHGTEPIVLCSSHALVATNVSFALGGLDPAQSMQEACAVMAMLLSLRGDDDANTFMTSYEGERGCQDCEELAAEHSDQKEGYMK